MANPHKLLNAHLDRAKNLIQDNTDEALELLNGLHAKYPNHFGPCVLTAHCMVELHRQDEAIEWSSKATELSPRSAVASTTKFVALFGSGKVEDALDEMERFLGVGKAEAYEEELLWWLTDLKQDEERKDIYEDVLRRVRGIANSYPPIAKVLEEIEM